MASRPPLLELQSSNTLTATTSDSISDSGDGDRIEELERTQTSATTRMARERQFEPIHAGDRAELTRLASVLSRRESVFSAQNIENELERKDTLAGIQLGDAVLDPTSPNFDAYKWARM